MSALAIALGTSLLPMLLQGIAGKGRSVAGKGCRRRRRRRRHRIQLRRRRKMRGRGILRRQPIGIWTDPSKFGFKY